MAVIKITNFGGEAPRHTARGLSGEAAQVNENLLATATDFRPLAAPGVPALTFGNAPNNPKSLYRTQRGGSGQLHTSLANGWVPAELQPPPMLDTDALWVILTGILGIAGARTFEKVRGVSK